MKNVLLAGALFVAVAFSTQNTQAQTWNLDKSHSSINFEINHFFTPTKGAFNDFEGELVLNPKDLSNAKIDFTIDVKSVDTDDAKRDEHLRAADFFDVAKFESITFVSSKVAHKGGKDYVATGDLTIRDVTKTIDLPFKIVGVADHAFKNGYLVTGMKSELALNRTDYGVGSGNFAATAVVGDEVSIDIFIEAHTKK